MFSEHTIRARYANTNLLVDGPKTPTLSQKSKSIDNVISHLLMPRFTSGSREGSRRGVPWKSELAKFHAKHYNYVGRREVAEEEDMDT